MKTAMVGNIQVQTAGRKKSDFDFSHTVNTTSRFGELQPVQCVKVNAHSKYKCNASTVIRALPLVAPVTSGTIKAKVYHKFVGMSDLLNSWPSYLTGQPKQTVAGPVRFTHPPYCKLRDLSAFCLVGCKFSIYLLENESTAVAASVDSSTTKWVMPSKLADLNGFFSVISSFDLQTVSSGVMSSHPAFSVRFPDYVSANNYAVPLDLFSSNFPHAFIPCWNSLIPESAFAVDGESNKLNANVDIRNCDFVFTRVLDAGSETGLGVDIDGQLKFAIAVNMSDLGLRFYKALVGLGYKPDFNSSYNVDITRFFAMYKAYFDSFGLTLWTNYELTDAYYLLKRFENSVGFSLIWDDISSNELVRDAWVRFMLDCAEMYVTDPLDYISAHRRQDVTSPQSSNAGFVSNIVLANENIQYFNSDGAFNTTPNNGSQAEAPSIFPSTKSIYINKVTHTQVDADLLKILYRTVNVQTVAGKRLAELLRAGGYGSFVDECKSSFIGMDEIELDITDINATADSTNDVTGRNSTLGETVGKGLALKSAKKDTFHEYETDEFGYWITLMCFVPESSYVQGVDQTIYDVDKFDEFQPDFDSVGYEIQNKSVVASGGDWFSSLVGSKSDDPFGFVPRYLRYKVPQSIINGGFLRRSERDYFLNYCLDRFIHFNDRAETVAPVVDSDSGRTTYTLTKYMDVDSLPLAGNAWRYVNRYPWLSSFERIFAYVGDVLKLGGLTSYGIDVQMARWRYCNFGEDGFMFFARFFADKSSPMLPLTKSWSTIDEPDKDGSVSMRQA